MSALRSFVYCCGSVVGRSVSIAVQSVASIAVLCALSAGVALSAVSIAVPSGLVPSGLASSAESNAERNGSVPSEERRCYGCALCSGVGRWSRELGCREGR